MVLTSTFPDFSEEEALFELNSGGSAPSSPAPLRRGVLAGWLRGFPATGAVGLACSAGRDDPAVTAITATPAPPRRLSTNPPTKREGDSGGDAREERPCARNRGGGGGDDRVAPVVAGGRAAGDRQVEDAAWQPPFPIPGNNPPWFRLSSAGEGPRPVTSKAVRRGDVVAVERPLLAAQSSGTLPWAAACPGCLRHVGSLEAQLAIASGRLSRAEALRCGVPAEEPSVPPPGAPAGSLGAAAGPSSIPPEPRASGAAAASRQTASGREENGGAGGRGEWDCEGGGGVGGASLPSLEGLSERFVQVRGGRRGRKTRVYPVGRLREWDVLGDVSAFA